MLGVRAGYVDIPTNVLWVALGGIVVLAVFLSYTKRSSAKMALHGATLREGRITGLTGLMGGGKSTLAALYIVRPWLRKGRTLVTNFGVEPAKQRLTGRAVLLSSENFLEDLLGIGVGGSFVDTGCRCSKYCKEHGHVDECGAARCENYGRRLRCSCEGIKLIIDEAQVFVPANNSRSLPIELKSWITLTRKNHIEMVWLAQSHKDVHAMLRRMTAEMWHCTDLEAQLVAQRFGVEAGEPGMRPLDKIGYRWNISADGMFNSWEIIIPAKDAIEMAGQLSRKYVDRLKVTAEMRNRAAGAVAEGAAPQPVTDDEVWAEVDRWAEAHRLDNQLQDDMG